MTLKEYLLYDALKDNPVSEAEFQEMLKSMDKEEQEMPYIFFVTTILVAAIIFLLFGVF